MAVIALEELKLGLVKVIDAGAEEAATITLTLIKVAEEAADSKAASLRPP